MKLEDLEIPLLQLKGIGPKLAEKLEKNHLRTVKDLLYFFPYRFEDLTKVTPIAQAKIGEPVLLIGKVSQLKVFRSPRKHYIITNGLVSDTTGSVRVMWFNQPYLISTLANEAEVALWGKLTKTKFRLHLSNPRFQLVKNETGFAPRILPIYSEVAGIATTAFEKILRKIFDQSDILTIKDPLPQSLIQKLALPALGQALTWMHQPQTLAQIQAARQRLSFEEIFYIQLKLLREKRVVASQKAPVINIDTVIIDDFLSNFDFRLTHDQKQVLAEILHDLAQPYPMNRLLQGEVGSGKTLVAEIAALLSLNSDYQVLLMAPTEILARQHFNRVLTDLAKFDFGLGLLVSQAGYFGQHGFKARKNPAEIFRLLTQKRVNFLIGTHALLELKNNSSQGLLLRNPDWRIGLVIIDEQHRFGVAQRQKLLGLSAQNYTPHLLSMTATPIPRTLALAFYGDLDLSMIKEKPLGRKRVETHLIKPTQRERVWVFAKKELVKGHQIFVICPRVEPTGAQTTEGRANWVLEIKAVKEEYEKIKMALPEFTVEIMHGKLKSAEKEQALQKLQEAQTQILVSSSVIEVGLDLPLATVIIIESAERFGLAQLHQLRGRVGRSIHQSYCFLIMEKYSALAYQRLKALVESDDALYLAEKDLQLRGAGEFLGERQSGLPDLAMEAIKDTNLVAQAKKLAEELLQTNPTLKDLPLLRQELDKRNYAII